MFLLLLDFDTQSSVSNTGGGDYSNAELFRISLYDSVNKKLKYVHSVLFIVSKNY